MADDSTVAIAEYPKAANAARLSSYDFLFEDDTDLEPYFAPDTDRELDAYVEGAAFLIALDPDPESAAQTREAITLIIDPSCNQVGPREMNR